MTSSASISAVEEYPNSMLAVLRNGTRSDANSATYTHARGHKETNIISCNALRDICPRLDLEAFDSPQVRGTISSNQRSKATREKAAVGRASRHSTGNLLVPGHWRFCHMSGHVGITGSAQRSRNGKVTRPPRAFSLSAYAIKESRRASDEGLLPHLVFGPPLASFNGSE